MVRVQQILGWWPQRARSLTLTTEERTLLADFFGSALDLDRLRLREGGLVAWGCTRVLGNTIYFDPRVQFPATRRSPERQALLIHEAVHVGQFQQQGWAYALRSLGEQGRAWVRTGSRRGAYHYTLLPERPLGAYGIEQQAQLLEDYFRWRWQGDGRGLRTHVQDFALLGPERAALLLEARFRDLGEGWRN